MYNVGIMASWKTFHSRQSKQKVTILCYVAITSFLPTNGIQLWCCILRREVIHCFQKIAFCIIVVAYWFNRNELVHRGQNQKVCQQSNKHVKIL